jgi:transcriptional regulator GlxA family with amidase domain
MLSIGILVFDGVEILDFSGPYEVFSTAVRVHRRLSGAPVPFSCFLIAPQMRPVRARGGMQVLPDAVLMPEPELDVLIVPGGDVAAALADPALAEWIALQAGSACITASVCTGAFLLARAGLLRGLPVTTHWEDLQALRSAFPDLSVQEGMVWIDCGRVVTSAGIAAGMAMSLHLVDRLAGRQLAQATARQMEYRWSPDEGIRRLEAHYPGLSAAA